jgi:hypothetical protein
MVVMVKADHQGLQSGWWAANLGVRPGDVNRLGSASRSEVGQMINIAISEKPRMEKSGGLNHVTI